MFEIDLGGQGGDILEASRELRDVLEAKRNKVFFHLFVGGHDALTWPGTIADALMDLFGNDGSQVQRYLSSEGFQISNDKRDSCCSAHRPAPGRVSEQQTSSIAT